MIDIVDPDYSLSWLSIRMPLIAASTSCMGAACCPFLSAVATHHRGRRGWSIPRVAPNPELRAELEAYRDSTSPAALHERLRQVDPVSAERIHPNNSRRVIRALEVQIVTGRPISEYSANDRRAIASSGSGLLCRGQSCIRASIGASTA